nr:hypothetical protein [uncultured Rhodoferax sp.]
MKIEQKQVTLLTITEAPNLDPIRVQTEDIEPGKGRITVSCWGKSWTSYWGGMGEKNTIADFFCSCNANYIIGNFTTGMPSTVFSGDALLERAKKSIIARRRGRCLEYSHLDKAEARELWTDVELANIDHGDRPQDLPSTLMTQLYGKEWWYEAERAQTPNHEYEYLTRIIHAVQAAFQQLKSEEVPV